MYDSRTLKPSRSVGQDWVECPVLGCEHRVQRQRRVFIRDERFRCPAHGIYISSSTFEYDDYHDNILTTSDQDSEVLDRIFAVKRETDRLGRERSEDALTFSVFRSLESRGALDPVMSAIANRDESHAVPSYWSFSLEHNNAHPLLVGAREAFGEVQDRGSEPDLIVETAQSLFLIEAKLDSHNVTAPSRPWVLDTYQRAEGNWFDTVFRTSPTRIARELKLYQLMRLWLLGTWMAEKAEKRFVLASLVPGASDRDIVSRFEPQLVLANDRKFVRHTWEGIRDQVRPEADRTGLAALVDYVDHKTLGYDTSGRLRMAFSGEAQA